MSALHTNWCRTSATAAVVSSFPLTFTSASHCSASRFSHAACTSHRLFASSSCLRFASSSAFTKSLASHCACCSSASNIASMLGAVIAAASPPHVFAGVMNKCREEGEDMVVEDKSLCHKTFPCAYLSTVPRFQVLPNFCLHLYHTVPDSNSTDFLCQPNRLNWHK